MTRSTGMSARRTKPMALGIVQAFHGASDSVCGGGGPERSRPNSRRNVSRGRVQPVAGAAAGSGSRALREAPPQLPDRLGASAQRDAALLVDAAAADLGLGGPGLERALADRQPQRHAEQLGVGELLARAGGAVVEQRVEPERRAARRTAPRRRPAPGVPGLPRPTTSTSHGAMRPRPRDALARRRTARRPRRRCARARSRRSP